MRNHMFLRMAAMLAAASLLLSACGEAGGSAVDPFAGAETPAEPGSGSQSESAADMREAVDLIWYIRQAEPKNRESVLGKANEIIRQEINATLDLRFINPGDYNDKMQIIMSSGEEFDICWTSEWANRYDSNVSKGAYLELDAYMNDEYLPDVLAAIPERIWDGVKVNGSVYGVPCLQVMYDQAGLWFNAEYTEKYGLDPSTIKSWEDLTPIFQTVKENEPEVYAYRGTIPGTKLENSFRQTPYTVISSRMFIFDPETKAVHNRFYEENMDTLKLFREWYLAGFIPNDAATLQDEVSLYRAGKLFSRYHRIKPGGDAEFKNTNGIEIIGVPIGSMTVTTSGVQSTLNAVSVTSQNPDLAVRLLNLTYQNKDLYNYLVFGLEGQDYEMVDENHLRALPDGYHGTSWMLGNQFNALLVEGQPDNVWEETITNNANAKYDPLLGFILDRTPIETQMASCEAVFKEYEPILLYGLDDPEKALAEMNTKLQAAGIEEATAEIQKQVDAFLAGN